METHGLSTQRFMILHSGKIQMSTVRQYTGVKSFFEKENIHISRTGMFKNWNAKFF